MTQQEKDLFFGVILKTIKEQKEINLNKSVKKLIKQTKPIKVIWDELTKHSIYQFTMGVTPYQSSLSIIVEKNISHKKIFFDLYSEGYDVRCMFDKRLNLIFFERLNQEKQIKELFQKSPWTKEFSEEKVKKIKYMSIQERIIIKKMLLSILKKIFFHNNPTESLFL